MISNLKVIVNSSSPFVWNSFFLHRPIFIGAFYRPLDSDVLPALLQVFRQNIGFRVSCKVL